MDEACRLLHLAKKLTLALAPQNVRFLQSGGKFSIFLFKSYRNQL